MFFIIFNVFCCISCYILCFWSDLNHDIADIADSTNFIADLADIIDFIAHLADSTDYIGNFADSTAFSVDYYWF